MDRRSFLRALAAGGIAGVAGCSAPEVRRTTPGNGTGSEVAGAGDLPIAPDELTRGAPKNAIPAITDPKFGEDWSGISMEVYNPTYNTNMWIEPRLQPSDRVIGVARGDEARAYPLRVLNWHEIVNDDFDGPLLVTYCPLCRTALTARRTVNGEATIFGVSGLLYKSNLVMFDRATESLWSQVEARAIHGPKTGERLSLEPSALTTLRDWRTDYPDTKVLLPPPVSETIAPHEVTRNYNLDPYAAYETTDQVGIDDRDYDRRLHPKTLVLGVAHGGTAKAYPLPAVRKAGRVVNDSVGGLPVVVAVTTEDVLVGYVRQVDGEVKRFDIVEGDTLVAAGTRWDATTGTAVSGRHEGATLDPATARPPMFWFSWADLHPETDIYGGATRSTRSSGEES